MVEAGYDVDFMGVDQDDDVELINTDVPCALSADQTVFLNLEQGTSIIFYFSVDREDQKIVFKAWERQLRQCFSDVDIYVTVNNETINETNY